MKVDVELVIMILSPIIGGIVGFFLAKSKLKDNIHSLKIDIKDVEKKMVELTSRDNEQQIVIDEIKRQFDDLLPILIKKMNKKNGK